MPVKNLGHGSSSACKAFQCPPHPVPFQDLQYHSSTCSIIPAPGVPFRALPDTISSLFFWSVASWTSFFGSWCFLIGGMGAFIWGCTSTMERISPNLLEEMDFKQRAVRGHCFLVMAKVLGFYTAIFLCFFW